MSMYYNLIYLCKKCHINDFGYPLTQWFSTFLVERNPKIVFQGFKETLFTGVPEQGEQQEGARVPFLLNWAFEK